jgi:hypothetical protein
MNNKHLLLFTLLFLFSACSVIEQKAPVTIHAVATSAGSKANPHARANHELMKLVDPETGKIPEQMREKELDFISSLHSSPAMRSVNTWYSRGPFNVGGRTRALVLDKTNENILLAGAASGGVWKSVDAGQSWYKVSPYLFNQIVTSIIQDPRPGHEAEWYYTTGELLGASQSAPGAFFLGKGVYKSEDGGETWASITSTSNPSPQSFDSFWEGIWRIAIDSSNLDATELYVATYGAIYRSANGGTSWQQVLLSSNASGSSYFSDVSVSPSGVVYATLSYENSVVSFGLGPNAGVYRSDDGITFTDIRPDDYPAQFGRTVMEIDPNDENTLYFLAANVDSLSGFQGQFFNGGIQYSALWKYEYLSGDGSGAGGQWTELTSNLPDGDGPFDDFYPQSGYDLTIRIDPSNSQNLFIGGTNLYRSTDAFSTADNTTQIGGYGIDSAFPDFFVYEDHHPDIHEMVFPPSSPSTMINATDGGLFKTTDLNAAQVQWTSLNHGYLSTQVYGLGIEKGNASDKLIAGFQDNGNYFTDSDDSQAIWTLPLNGDGAYTAFAQTEDYVLMSIQQGRVFKCLIGADGMLSSFERIDPGLEADGHEFIHPFVLDPENDARLYFPYQNKLYYHFGIDTMAMNDSFEADALGWQTFTDSIPFAGLRITSISMAEDGSGRMYLGTNNEKVFRIDDASNPASPFVDVTDSALPPGHIDCIAIDPIDSDKAMIVYTNYNVYSLYYTEDAGVSWEKVGGNLEQTIGGTGNGPSCRWARIHRWHPDSVYYFVGTSVGLFSTSYLDGTNTLWNADGPENIGSSIVSYIDSRMTDRKVFIGTHGAGVYCGIVDQVELTSGLQETETEVSIRLFPNPATSTIQVDCYRMNGAYTLRIFDSSGRLMSHMNTYGPQRPLMDLTGFSAGRYTIVVESKELVKSESFIKH